MGKAVQNDNILPLGWSKHTDPNSGYPFFYNAEKNIKTWNVNVVFEHVQIQIAGDQRSSKMHNTASIPIAANNNQKKNPTESKVVIDEENRMYSNDDSGFDSTWVKYKDSKSGQFYYYNAEKNQKIKQKIKKKQKRKIKQRIEHQQFDPQSLASATYDKKKSSSSAWEEYIDPSSGDTYYYNKESHIKTWHKEEATSIGKQLSKKEEEILDEVTGDIINDGVDSNKDDDDPHDDGDDNDDNNNFSYKSRYRNSRDKMLGTKNGQEAELATIKPTKIFSTSESAKELLKLNIFSTTVQKMIIIKRLIDGKTPMSTDQFKELYHSTVNNSVTDPKTDTLIMISISKLLFQNRQTVDMNDHEIIDMQEILLKTAIKSQKDLHEAYTLRKEIVINIGKKLSNKKEETTDEVTDQNSRNKVLVTNIATNNEQATDSQEAELTIIKRNTPITFFSTSESAKELLKLNIFSTTVQKMIIIKRLVDGNTLMSTDQFKELYHSTVNDPVTDPKTNTLIMISISKLLFQNRQTVDMNDHEIIDMQEILLKTAIKSHEDLHEALRRKARGENEQFSSESSTSYEGILLNTTEETIEMQGKQEQEGNFKSYNFAERQAIRIARNPKTHFWIHFIVCLALSLIATIFGNFTIVVSNVGFFSRGTEIANEYTQILLLILKRTDLFRSKTSEQSWEEYTTNVQPGWEGTRILKANDLINTELQDYGDSSNGNNFIVESNKFPITESSPFFDTESNDVRTYYSNDLELLFGSNNKHHNESYYNQDERIGNDNDNFPQILPVRHSDHHQQFISSLINRNLQLDEIFDETISSFKADNFSISDGGYNPSILKCDWDWYTSGKMDSSYSLKPIWKVTKPESTDSSALDSDILREICIAEQNTQKVLEKNGLCFGCPDEQCLPPYSIVLYVRLKVENGLFMDCATLADAWDAIPTERKKTQETWKNCTNDFINSGVQFSKLPESCEITFFPSIVDTTFRTEGIIKYTSSIFATSADTQEQLYEHVEEFDRGGNLIEGVYETRGRHFAAAYANEAIIHDITLAMTSGFVTVFAMLLHTKSIFLTCVGVVEIMFSFPLAYFVYHFIGQLEFFPFLNFMGMFIVFALGADHIFVSVDKWKNTRIEHPLATTEEIAAIALPDAAGSMFLTTTTTAVAFFGTAICRVAPIRLFAVFCGLLVALDYIVDILLIFPCLCIYDANTNNCCMSVNTFWCFRIRNRVDKMENKNKEHRVNDKEEGNCGTSRTIIALYEQETRSKKSKVSLIHRILLRYYEFLHRFRWFLLIAAICSFSVCAYFAAKLPLPSSTDIILLDDKVQFEQHFDWNKNIVLEELRYRTLLGPVNVVWGLKPSDTGDLNSPNSFSQLVLDETFDPSTERAQIFLRDFCGSIFQEEFAELPHPNYVCAINDFDNWLKSEWMKANQVPPGKKNDDIYVKYCANTTEGLPIPKDIFHPCIVNWAEGRESSILSRNGIVKTIDFYFLGRSRSNDSNREIHRERNLIENWMESTRSDAEAGVSSFFFGSAPFWMYDGQTEMFNTAFAAGGGCLGVVALVILFHSKSFAMMVFSILSIAYVLVSVTAIIEAIGWSLGFLESICFSILIGISADYVIHFSYAYTSLPGNVHRSERTKYALISMGPSILAAAFTTISSSIFMLFTELLFFRKFGIILCLTLLQAVIGCFVVFLILTDCFGPSNPTHLVDLVCNKGHKNWTKLKTTVLKKVNQAKKT